jgi:PAS domain S-box-containing protein
VSEPVAPTAEDLTLADAMPHIVWIHDAEGRVSYFNKQWTAYTGLTVEETRTEGPASHVHPADLVQIQPLFRSARAAGEELEATYRLRGKDGCYRWHHARVVPLRREGDRVVSFLGTATDIHEEHELQLQRMYLVEASRVLGTSLELDKTLADVARLLVPHIADWCAIDLLDDTGKLFRQAVAHVDPTKVQLGWELWNRRPPRPDDPTGSYAVMRTGQPEWTREITDEMLTAALPDPELLALFRGLGLRSALIVPLSARSRMIGTLSLVTAESEQLFEERDVAFGLELASRIAIAVDNARLFGEATHARTTAEAFAQEILEQSRAVEATVVELRRQRDEALARTKT